MTKLTSLFLNALIALPSCWYTKKSTCDIQQLLHYDNINTPNASVVVFEPSPAKKLIFFATYHLSTPNNPIVTMVDTIFKKYNPQFCILEGFDSSEGINPTRILEMAHEYCAQGKHCENLYTANLCHQHAISFIGGDPRESSYLEALKSYGFNEEDVIFFWVATMINQWHRNNEVHQNTLPNKVNDLIQQSLAWSFDRESLPYTYADFLTWHNKKIGKPFNITQDFLWKIPTTNELQPSTAPDATIYQQLQAHIQRIRDTHVLMLAQDALKQHDIVLIVYGASHYECQKGALACLFKKPVSRIFLDEITTTSL